MFGDVGGMPKTPPFDWDGLTRKKKAARKGTEAAGPLPELPPGKRCAICGEEGTEAEIDEHRRKDHSFD
jgi:hypothetical protein